MRRFIFALITINFLLIGALIFSPQYQRGAFAKIEYINSIQSTKTDKIAALLAIGDSTIAYAVIPKIGIELKIPVVSLALPGTTMVTARKELVRYLENHPAPKCLIVSTGNEPEIYGINFWRLHSSLGLFSKTELKEIYETSNKLSAYPAKDMSLSTFLNKDFLFRHLFFTVKSQLRLRAAIGISGQLEKEIALHQQYISNTYGHSFRFGDNSTTKKTERNDYLYQSYVENESELKTFLEILRIANENSIEVIYSLWPVLTTEGKQPVEYAAAHEKYLRGATPHARNLRFFKVATEFTANDFYDVHHLNRVGAQKYSKELFNQLPPVCKSL